jgi:hypothetical protein
MLNLSLHALCVFLSCGSGGALVKLNKQEERQEEEEEVVAVLSSTDNISDAIVGPPAS